MSTQTEAILDLIREWAANNQLQVPADTSRTFADAGFDSLHSTELAFFLEEKLGVAVDETVLFDQTTFDALAQHLAEQTAPGQAAGAQSPNGDNRPTAEAAEW